MRASSITLKTVSTLYNAESFYFSRILQPYRSQSRLLILDFLTNLNERNENSSTKHF